MKEQRSIILAIVSCTTDYVNQVVLTEAGLVDREGTRTLGVITKPDRIQARESLEDFLQLGKNQTHPLELGWHVLKNRSSDEREYSWDERNMAEQEFFAKEGRDWNEIGKENVGIEPLLRKLGRLLLKHIAQELPKILEELVQKQQDCDGRLKQLGEAKNTVQEMREELRALWEASKEVVTQGCMGNTGIHSSAQAARFSRILATRRICYVPVLWVKTKLLTGK
jgi:hypothetical protein